MNYGVEYYPQQWPEDRWAVDAGMMARAGINVVRMGDLSWSAFEPEEGNLRFDWMERAVALLGRHGIGTILCTCGRTPPRWVFMKHPSIVTTGPDGQPVNAEGRYRAGLGHPEFLPLAERIDQAMVEHFRGNPNIIGWQVDNEVGSGNDCWCDRCVELFQKYLEARYKTVEHLNEAWGEHFWSLRFGNFAEVPRPGSNPQLKLEYRRFLSQLNVDFVRWRTALIHRLDPGKFVTTNLQNIRAAHTDARGLIGAVDEPGCNHYPQRTPELMLDYYRGRGGTLHVLEQFTRLQFDDTGEGWMGLWAWMAVAHGAATVTHFRWRCCRWGNEQFADGILPHSGKENRRYRELAKVGSRLRQAASLIDGTKPIGRAAIVYSYESRWAVQAGLFPKNFDPVEEAAAFHSALKRRNVPTDAMDPRENLSGYRLVIAPRAWVIDEETAENFRRYVEGGGVLLLTTGSGVADEFGKSFAEPRPGKLADMAGLEVDDLAWLGSQTLQLESQVVAGLGAGHTASDEMHPTSAETLAQYSEGWRKGHPAITRRRVGAGQVIYLGTLLGTEGVQALVDWACREAKVEGILTTPDKVVAYERCANDYRLVFLLNFSDRMETVELPPQWEAQDAFTKEMVERVKVEAVQMRLLVVSKKGARNSS